MCALCLNLISCVSTHMCMCLAGKVLGAKSRHRAMAALPIKTFAPTVRVFSTATPLSLALIARMSLLFLSSGRYSASTRSPFIQLPPLSLKVENLLWHPYSRRGVFTSSYVKCAHFKRCRVVRQPKRREQRATTGFNR